MCWFRNPMCFILLLMERLYRGMFQNDGQKLPGTLCDHQFISSNFTPSYGRFYSPRYPSSYPKHVKCAYRFRARTRERIRVVFEEVTLQKGDVSCLNRADLVKVHDGRSSLTPVIIVLCNEAAALEVLSTGQDLYIEFVSNSDWPGQGFKATFQFQPLDLGSTSDTPHTETTRMNVIQGSSTPLLKSTDFGPAVSATTTEDTEVEELEELLSLNDTEAPPTTVRSRVIVCPKGFPLEHSKALTKRQLSIEVQTTLLHQPKQIVFDDLLTQ